VLSFLSLPLFLVYFFYFVLFFDVYELLEGVGGTCVGSGVLFCWWGGFLFAFVLFFSFVWFVLSCCWVVCPMRENGGVAM